MMFRVAVVMLEGFVVTGFLVIAALVFLQAERRIGAFVEHRVGPDQVGPGGAFQLVADLTKMIWRGQRSFSASGAPFWILLFSLPFSFTAILFFETLRAAFSGREVLVLFLLVLCSILMEGSISIWRTVGAERYAFLRHMPSRVLGILTFSVCLATVFLHTGSTSLAAIGEMQAGPPFLMLLRGPGLFLSSAVFFLSVLVMEAQRPFADGADRSVDGSKNFFFQFLSRLWVVALFSFWIFVYGGGLDGSVSWILFPLRLAIAVAAHIWMSLVFPGIRSGDTQEIQLRVLLPGALLAFVAEAAWLALVGGGS